jgi:hypothetical protein
MKKFLSKFVFCLSILPQTFAFSNETELKFIQSALSKQFSVKKNETVANDVFRRNFNVNNVFFSEYDAFFKIHKTISNTIDDTKTVICIFEKLNTEQCSFCPATILFVEWQININTGEYTKKYQTIMDSSGTFGSINGTFTYHVIDKNTSFILYNDIVEDKNWTTVNAYIIQDGNVQHLIPESAQSNKKYRVISKNNIIEYNTVFSIDNKTKTVNAHKTGILYKEKINERQNYKLK